MFRVFFVVLGALYLALPQYSYAILPPSFIVSVGSQFVQFFSVIILIVGGVTGSVLMYLRPHFYFVREHLYAVLAALVVIILGSIAGVYMYQEAANKQIYLEQIEALNKQIEEATRMATYVSSSTAAYPTSTGTEGNWESLKDARRLFVNDTLFLYGGDARNPFYLEIDLNRRQVPNGTFMHYYYVVSVFDGEDRSYYDRIFSTSTVPMTTDSILNLTLRPYSDLSTRYEHQGTVLLGDLPVSFSTFNLQGDFITKNFPTYTRYQSIGDGIVTYNNEKIAVQVLSEGIHSSDFEKSIFFEGSDSVNADTRQFVLWDSVGNFYMIDQSVVTPEIPQYTSHTWLLYTDKKEGYTKKSFTSDITAQSIMGGPETGWSITAPDFKNGSIKLSRVKEINDGDAQTRSRVLVEGTIADSDGVREIRGFAFIIK